MQAQKPSRRTFMKTTAAAGAASLGGLIPSTVLGANDRIQVGVIGTGGRGTYLLKNLVERSDQDNIKVVAVSDVYKRRQSEAQAVCGGDGHMDYRELLERTDVDAVVIATPDHWHSKMCIDAMDAGKDVFCEKPMTLTAEQAVEVRDAVRRYGKVLQVGPQRTSQDKYWQASDMIHAGKLGKVTWAQGSWNRNNRGRSVFGSSTTRDDPVGPFASGEDYIDWDMWLGWKFDRAPRIPWNPQHFFYFRGYFDYNGGVATDLLYHFLAPLLLAIVGRKGEYPLRATGNGGLYANKDSREVPDAFFMTVDFPSEFTVQLESVLTNEFTRPTRIYGRYGTMEFTERSSDLTATATGAFKDKFREENDGYDKIVLPPRPRRDLFGNMFDVIREGGTLHCGVDLGATTMVAIKMGVEAYRQSKTMLWDVEKETVVPA